MKADGYRLGSSGALPPLLLDDEEAVAVAIGLRTAASSSIAGIEETSVRALAKLHQVDADFTIVDSPELVDALRKLTKRYQRAIDASQQASSRFPSGKTEETG